MESQLLSLNKPQKRFVLSNPTSATNIWSRGTGKSYVIGWLLRHLSKTMPGSKWGVVGQTYRQIMTRTLPSTISGLNAVGQHLNEDYIINAKPPRSLWQLPHEPPLDWSNFMLFRSGFGVAFISLEGASGVARGMNLDGIITDESLLIDKEKFEADVLPANRGNLRYFEKHGMHHAIFHFTSMPYGSQGRWLLKHSDYYNKRYHYDFESIRRKIILAELDFIDCPDQREKLEIWKNIVALKKTLRFFKNTSGFLYSEADIFDNIHNIGLKYIYQQRESMTDFLFETEILNKRSNVIQGGFYPGLNPDVHLYSDSLEDKFSPSENIIHERDLDSRYDGDCVKSQPLRIAVDWGGKISVLSIAQIIDNEYRFINCQYVKHPKLIDDLAKKFLSYYKWHPRKEIDFIPDIAWGNKKQSNSIYTYNEKFIDLLEKAGWMVHTVNVGVPMEYQERYLLWNQYFQEGNSELLVIRMNKDKCRPLIMSMQMAPVKEGRDGRIEKDKASERNDKIPQEEATHFSDTADQHLMSIDKTVIRNESAFIPNYYGS